MAISESVFRTGDITSLVSFQTGRQDAPGKTVADSAKMKKWGAENADDFAVGHMATHKVFRGTAGFKPTHRVQDIMLLGQNDGLEVDDHIFVASGSLYKCLSVTATTSTWAPVTGTWLTTDFGCDPTGQTDNTTEVQAMFLAAPDGSELGLVGETLVSPDSLLCTRWFHFRGIGMAVAITPYTGFRMTGDGLLLDCNTEAVDFFNVSFRGPGEEVGAGAIALRVRRPSGNPNYSPKFNQLWIEGFRTYGLETLAMVDGRFLNCTIENCGYGIFCEDTSGPNRVIFAANKFIGCNFSGNDFGVWVHNPDADPSDVGDPQTEHNLWVGCSFQLNGTHDAGPVNYAGLYFGENMNYNRVVGCQFYDQVRQDIYCAGNVGNSFSDCVSERPGRMFFYGNGATDLHFSNCEVWESNFEKNGTPFTHGFAFSTFTFDANCTGRVVHCRSRAAGLSTGGEPEFGMNIVSTSNIKVLDFESHGHIANEMSGTPTDFDGHSQVQRTVRLAVVASTTQTQGQAPLVKEWNEVTSVANTDDVVTMPPATVGKRCKIRNSGVNQLQIFPVSGDNFQGSAVNASVTLAASSIVEYECWSAGEWRT